MVSRLNIARVLVVIGLFIGLESLRATFSHIGDPLFTLPPEFGGGTKHAWYHVLREFMGDVATITAILVIFFAPGKWRVPATWWLCLIIMFGYFSPFWIGMPFNSALAAPSLDAEIRHIVQAVLPLAGLFLARASFFNSAD